MIGNADTLLPDFPAPDTEALYSIPSCWPEPGPDFFEPMIARLSSGNEDRAKRLRADFLCPAGTEPQPTGTPLALDAPYPEGHPLANRDD